eukprot:5853302-Prymnesium_polylepis.1
MALLAKALVDTPKDIEPVLLASFRRSQESSHRSSVVGSPRRTSARLHATFSARLRAPFDTPHKDARTRARSVRRGFERHASASAQSSGGACHPDVDHMSTSDHVQPRRDWAAPLRRLRPTTPMLQSVDDSSEQVPRRAHAPILRTPRSGATTLMGRLAARRRRRAEDP